MSSGIKGNTCDAPPMKQRDPRQEVRLLSAVVMVEHRDETATRWDIRRPRHIPGCQPYAVVRVQLDVFKWKA
tara:strand:+ start:453 stop:668 length:216 start_codon:yes stop_codon:yes gene_type:complete